MHASSYENMQYCYDTYVQGEFLAARDSVTAVDLGSFDVNGSYRPIFNGPKVKYIGVDLVPGLGVDLVLSDPYHVPLPDASADIVLSGQMLEHCECFWLAFQEMVRILKPGGLLFLIAPSEGGIHRYPVDCYRFYPDAYRSLAKYAGCMLLNMWRDERKPWKDLVGVFSRRNGERNCQDINSNSADRGDSLHDSHVAGSPEMPTFNFSGARDANIEVAGTSHYLDVLKNVHAVLQPRRYLEIGVAHGNSLALASNEAIGVDPAPRLRMERPTRGRLFHFQETSDRFFDEHANAALASGVDLGFIDGMHLFENALRDFMNIEHYAHPASVIVFDDIFPNHALQAARQRQTSSWTGDIWKIVACFQKYRPDLLLLRLDSGPTGLLLVAGLDGNNCVLRELYDTIVAEFTSDQSGEVPQEVLDRTGAIDPDDSRLAFLLHELYDLRCAGASCDVVRRRLHEWCVALFPPTAKEEQHVCRGSARSGHAKEQRFHEQVVAMSRNFADVQQLITQQQLMATQNSYVSFLRSSSWAMWWRQSRFRSWAVPYGTRRWQLYQLAIRGWQVWKLEGLRQILIRVWRKTINRFHPMPTSPHG